MSLQPKHSIAAFVLRQTLIIAAVGLPMTVIVATAFHQRLGRTLLYTLCVTVCCSLFIQSMLTVVARLRGNKNGWPGWPWLLAILVVGVMAGNPAGEVIGNWLSGIPNANPLTGYTLNSFLFVLLVSMLPAGAISYFFHSRGRLAEARTQAAEHQLRLLAAQLEPHMLFNTLANLRVLIGLDQVRAQAMLDQLIGFLRATLSASRQGSHPLREEFARLHDYLALMQVRMGERLSPVFELPPELADVPVPPMLLQPLVENAIKHGLEPAVDGGELRVSARRVKKGLVLEVRDAGMGLGTTLADSTGFGLQQVRERLAATYGDSASFSLQAQAPRGCIATITLPLLPLP